MYQKRYEHSPAHQDGSLSAAQRFTEAPGGVLGIALGAAFGGALGRAFLFHALTPQARECAGHVGPENLSVVVGSDPPGAWRRCSAGHAVWVPAGGTGHCGVCGRLA